MKIKLNAASRLIAAEEKAGRLFHGTDAYEAILKGGFKPTTGGMYGNGVYFTEDHDKADFFKKGGKVLEVELPDTAKFKRFKSEEEYEDFKEEPAVEALTKKLQKSDSWQDKMAAQDQALNAVLKERGYIGHSVKRSSSEYFVVHDPKDIKRIFEAEH